MKSRIKLGLFAVSLFLSACGGGGDSQIVPNYEGSWSGGVSLVSNTCARQIPEEFKFIPILHYVQQSSYKDANGNTILDVVLNDGVDSFYGLGEVHQNGSGNSFSVSGGEHELLDFISGYRCVEVIDFSYSSIDFDSDYAGFVQRHSTITCTKGTNIQNCDVNYTGNAYRMTDH